MKANELRIRNYISYDNRIFQIHTIADEYPTLNTIEFGIGVVDWNNIKPVNLTEEWLLKFGFNQGGYDLLFWYKDGLEFSGLNWDDIDSAKDYFSSTYPKPETQGEE